MPPLISQLLVAALTMGVLDYVWLKYIASTLYKSELGNLLLDKPNMWAAVGFYAIYTIGVVAFVIAPAIERNSLGYALGYGALFGLVAYATYDLTNLATLKGFSLKVVAVDLLWGALLTATVAGVTYGILTR